MNVVLFYFICIFLQERTDAYRRAIVENPSLFRGSTVMDVGCGTGILR